MRNVTCRVATSERCRERRGAWKIRLIQSMNSEWADMFDETAGVLACGPADIARNLAQ